MRIGKIFFYAALCAATLCLTGCGGTDVVPRDNSGTKVGVAMPSQQLLRWNRDGAYLESELRAKEFAVDVAFAGGDAVKQAGQIEEMIAEGCKVLVVSAVDSKALAPVLERAKREGVTVIAYDRLLMGTDAVDYYATFDSYSVGMLQAQTIVDRLGLAEGKGPFYLEFAAGPTEDSNAKVLFAGAMDVLRPYIEQGKLVVRSGERTQEEAAVPGWATLMAEERMKGLLAQYGEGTKIDAVLAANDSIALGVLDALKEAGYGTAGRPLPILTGQDADLPNVHALIAGEQTMSVFKDTRRLALETAKLIEAIVGSHAPEINDTQNFMNGKKVVPAHVLKGTFVDASNYKSVLVDSGYYSTVDIDGTASRALGVK
ncbi:sugar-binding protein [Selenomonas sp. F0473]|uniref:substrate-binding domain-containing protein n=1 Tax=Selenomonas sp. F0473 TaxID=999423 RepID=UPI00029E4F54|nr:sugar-binding protein [Selenomonas sp. F0473]EKU71079.1 hypothetical protein HMPREF9161_01173 [Selenomonas sp. F0473]